MVIRHTENTQQQMYPSLKISKLLGYQHQVGKDFPVGTSETLVVGIITTRGVSH
jgi:hypothetical protein